MPSIASDAEDRLLTEHPLPEVWAGIITRMTPFLTRAAIHALLFLLLVGIHQFVTGILFLILGSIIVGVVGVMLYRSLRSSLTFVTLPAIPRNPFLSLMEKEGLPLDVAFSSGFPLIVLPPKEKPDSSDVADDTGTDTEDGSDQPSHCH